MLEKFAQLLGGKARIAEYGTEQTDRNVSARVHRHDHVASIRVNEYSVRSSLAINAKTRPC